MHLSSLWSVFSLDFCHDNSLQLLPKFYETYSTNWENFEHYHRFCPSSIPLGMNLCALNDMVVTLPLSLEGVSLVIA